MYLECCGEFSECIPERLSLKYKIVLKGVLSGETRIDSEQVKESQQEKAIGLEVQKNCFTDGTTTGNLPNRTVQKQQQTQQSDDTIKHSSY